MTEMEIIDEIGILTLKNPPQNYLPEPEFISIREVKEWVEKNQLKGLIITGTGRHFSGGAEQNALFEMAKAGNEMEEQMSRGKELLDFFQDLRIPVVAAIQGVCFGGGLEIALACHIRVCSENALFAFPETNLGLMPGLGGTQRLGERFSFQDSMKMILGGDMINAEEAFQLKLADTIVKNEDPFSYSLNFLKRITEGRQLKIINNVMQALQNAKRLPVEEAMREETRMFCNLARIESERRKKENE